MLQSNVGYFGHGRFGHGHFGQDFSATDISAMENAKGGRFGHNHTFMYFLVYRFSWIGLDVCGGCMYMCLHACMPV